MYHRPVASPDPRSTITRILSETESPEVLAEQVVPLLYSELRRIAASLLTGERKNHTLQCTDIVHEAYLRLFNQDKLGWQNRRHFLGCAASAMRRVLVDYARRRRAGKRIPATLLTSVDLAIATPILAPDYLDVHEALRRLETVDPRLSQVVELRYFGGLTEQEVAEVLLVSRRTVIRRWKVARVWLEQELSKT